MGVAGAGGTAAGAGGAAGGPAGGAGGATGAGASAGAPPGGEACASRVDDAALTAALKPVGEALAGRDLAALARAAHPTKGVRFSPYAYVDPSGDRVLKPHELAAAMGDPKAYTWGSYDGSGDPIRLTFRAYFDKFVYDRDFVRLGQVSRNRTIRTGNTKSNLCERYPGAAFVEYHLPGDPKAQGMSWASLRLVFEATPGGVYLVGVVHDQWTI
ncbi:MAG TPA: hypothetical protein VFS00_25115 [Polyangiaceae bacterium]|nr:hypothetical protein [Polyangiaceae bacterium]